SLKRRVASMKVFGGSSGPKLTNTLDAAGNVLQAQRIPTSGSAVTLASTSYDVLGRPVYQTNALGGITTNLYLLNSSGARRDVILYPDGGTVTNDYQRDGRISIITGTAGAPVDYEYGIENVSSAPDELWQQYT